MLGPEFDFSIRVANHYIFPPCHEDEVRMDLKRAEEGGGGARNKVRWVPVLVEKVIRVSHLEGNSSWG